jgi:hypothetical protein
MHTTNDPTRRTYTALQAAVWHFNRALLDGALPSCLVTLQRRSGSLGYFAAEKLQNRTDGSITDEIALNPKHILKRPPELTLSTLVHEMVHLRQHHYGNPGAGGTTTRNGRTGRPSRTLKKSLALGDEG